MKLFQFEGLHGLLEWVFHYSQYEAVELYTRETGCSIDDFEVKEINQSLWSELKIVDPDSSEPDEEDQDENYNPDDYRNGHRIEMTFEEFAEDLSGPEYIPTTEF